jgi:parallel beta-helix repeat protein
MKVPTAAISAILLGLVSAKTRTVTKTSGQTIQQVIDASHPGDRIVVEKGDYPEQLTITKNGISLVGHDARLVVPNTPFNNTCSGLAGADVTNEADPNVDTQAGICITGGGVSLEGYKKEHRNFISVASTVKEVSVTGFTVIGFGLGIVVIGARDTSVSSNTLIDNNFYGALTVGSKNTEIKHNTVSSTPLPSPFIRVIGICMDDQNPVSVHDNEISEYFIGLCVQTNAANVYNNKVHNACYGAYIDPKVDGARVHDNEICGTGANCHGNPIFGDFVYGIAMAGAINSVVNGNTIKDMTGYGIIIFDDASGAIASGNLIEKNKISAPKPHVEGEFDIQIETSGKGNVVKKNNICATSFPAGLC